MRALGEVAGYWKIVEDCLVELFELSRTRAKAEIADLRTRLLRVGANTRSPNDLIYHTEPLHIAADLARVSVNEHEALLPRYREIRDRYMKPLDTAPDVSKKARRAPSSPPRQIRKEVATAWPTEMAAAR